jgi:hypothetical protein
VKAFEIRKLRAALRIGFGIACFTFVNLTVGIDILGAEAGPASRPSIPLSAVEREFVQTAAPMFKQFCSDCHGEKKAKAQLDLARLSSEPNFGNLFKTWEKVIAMLEQKEMPPEEEPQPSDAERTKLIASVREALAKFIRDQAGDPGRIAMRQLTSAEYAYSIRDLTGLDLGFEHTLVSDAVGGEGFSNVGDVQFIQDSTLERYLEAAKTVASHAVIGAGPLQFYRDAGKTGQELSAINRIKEIYRQHGFRTGAGEGALAFGLDFYPRAFYAAWRFQHRRELGLRDVTLAKLAQEEGLGVRSVEHIWSVLSDPKLSFPATEIAAAWRKLPAPTAGNVKLPQEVRARCEDIYKFLRDWQGTLASNSGNDEEAPVLSEDSFRPALKNSFRAVVSWPKGATNAAVDISVIPATGQAATNPTIVWRQPRVRFRQGFGVRRNQPGTPLKNIVSPAAAERLNFGQSLNGASIEAGDFMTSGSAALHIDFPVPAGAAQAELLVDAQLDIEHGDDCLVRCVISSTVGEGVTAAASGTVSALLANPNSAEIDSWKPGVIEFARKLPQVSHREPAPADRDPIPAPYDNSYNNSERNAFHYVIKYHRDDRFLTENILDDAARASLNQAWTDLLASFEYHNTFLRFVVKKFKLDLEEGRGVANLSQDWMDHLPDEPRPFVKRLREQYASAQRALELAQPGHVEDAIRLAHLAWRRPLSEPEEIRLRSFYASLRKETKLDHAEALRALLARILVAPAFLYRVEAPAVIEVDKEAVERPRSENNAVALSNAVTPGLLPLPARGEQGEGRGEGKSNQHPARVPHSDWELASRLSYFLWSSIPDDELRRAAAAGELRNPDQLTRQAQRMLRDPKARRFATEFFGQWFGFYRFDGYRGIDAKRFAEFTDTLKAGLYDEAVSFFEYIVREDRPVQDILFADYSFLNRDLAQHYGIDTAGAATNGLARVEGVNQFHRGGLLRLGAVLAVTSAPLRTSAVKRGDWLLRRVLGTPVPPPPGDAGSIPPDDVLSDGQTVRRRLEAHRRDASCVNCHSRIDPFGFALENFDPIGRWREKYRDGQEIETTGKLHDGTEISGLEGLYRYLRTQEAAVHRTLCAKLLGYALGRGELISDQPLLDQMTAGLKTDRRFSTLISQIVTSTQFRYQRSHDAEAPP